MSSTEPSLFHVEAIKWTGLTPKGLKRGQFNKEVLKPAYQDLGEYFHAKMLPKRFTIAGGRMLNYDYRSGERPGTSYKAFWKSYTGRKVRKFGHRKPLVWSGETERDATRIRDIRTTSRGVKIVLHARKLNFRNKYSSIFMNEEVRRVSPQEYTELKREFERAVQRRIKQVSRANRETRKTRGSE